MAPIQSEAVEVWTGSPIISSRLSSLCLNIIHTSALSSILVLFVSGQLSSKQWVWAGMKKQEGGWEGRWISHRDHPRQKLKSLTSNEPDWMRRLPRRSEGWGWSWCLRQLPTGACSPASTSASSSLSSLSLDGEYHLAPFLNIVWDECSTVS